MVTRVLKTTSKLTGLFHRWQDLGRKIKIINIECGQQKIIPKPPGFNHPKDKLFLIKDGKYLNKRESLEVSKSLKVEKKMMELLTPQQYALFHESTSRVFYDFIGIPSPENLVFIPEDLRFKVIKALKSLSKSVESLIKIVYHSKDKLGVNFINELIKLGSVKRINGYYHVYLGADTKSVLEQHSNKYLNENSYMKIHQYHQ